MELARSMATRYVRLRPRDETRPKAKLLSDFVSRRGALGLCVFEVPLVLLFPLVPLDPIVVSLRPSLVHARTHARTHARWHARTHRWCTTGGRWRGSSTTSRPSGPASRPSGEGGDVKPDRSFVCTFRLLDCAPSHGVSSTPWLGLALPDLPGRLPAPKATCELRCRSRHVHSILTTRTSVSRRPC